jgi:hypothetical protein
MTLLLQHFTWCQPAIYLQKVKERFAEYAALKYPHVFMTTDIT